MSKNNLKNNLLSKNNFSIIAHRAINFIDPENSLKAFEWSMRKGYSIELDVYLTKDGVPVVSHDKTVDKLLNGTGLISSFTLAQIKKLRFKSDSTQSIPTFEEVCKLYSKLNKELDLEKKGFFFCIQIKDMYEKNVMEKTYELVKKYNLPKDSFFFEVDDRAWSIVEYVKKKLSRMPVALHLPETSKFYSKEHFKKSDVIWADEITFDFMTEKMVKLAHSHGKKIYAISAELIPHSKNALVYRKRWKDICDYGFDGICTDHPEELEIFLKEYSTMN